MRKLIQFATDFIKAEDGPTAVEYAVMLALIIVVCIWAVSAPGSNASNTFQYVGSKVKTTSRGVAYTRRSRPATRSGRSPLLFRTSPDSAAHPAVPTIGA